MSNCNHKQMYATKAAADEYALFYNSDLLRSETDKLTRTIVTNIEHGMSDIKNPGLN